MINEHSNNNGYWHIDWRDIGDPVVSNLILPKESSNYVNIYGGGFDNGYVECIWLNSDSPEVYISNSYFEKLVVNPTAKSLNLSLNETSGEVIVIMPNLEEQFEITSSDNNLETLTIEFDGTKAQWNTLLAKSELNDLDGMVTVNCSDGTIEL